MNSQNNEEKKNTPQQDRHYSFEDFDVTFKHDDSSNDDFAEVIIEGRRMLGRESSGEYLQNVVLASGVQALQSERFREKTRSVRAAEKALKDLETQSLQSLKGEQREEVKEPALQEADTVQEHEVPAEPIAPEVPERQAGEREAQPKAKAPFQVDERDENSDKRRHHYPKKHSNSRMARRWRKMKKWQRGIIIFLLLLLALILAAVITVYTMHHSGQKAMMSGSTAENFQDIITVDGVDYMYNTDITTIAFFGVDKEKFGLEDDLVGTAGQNDVNMVAAVNIKSGETHIIVIPRDAMVDVNKYSLEGDYMGTSSQQLCLSYAYGDGRNTSCDNAITSLQRILYGIPINTYVALNLDGISELNDAIGGVKLICPNDYSDQYKKGEEITLHGDDAESFIRSREETLEGDAARRERQIAYVKAYISQAAKIAMRDPGSLTDIYNIGKQYTVTNLTLSRSLYFGSSVLSNASQVMAFENVQSLSGKLQLDEAGYAQTILNEDNTLQTVLDVYYTALQ